MTCRKCLRGQGRAEQDLRALKIEGLEDRRRALVAELVRVDAELALLRQRGKAPAGEAEARGKDEGLLDRGPFGEEDPPEESLC